MNNRELKKAINKGRVFIGALIPIPQNERLLFGELFEIIRRIESDKKRVAISDLGELYPALEIKSNHLLFCWVLVPDNQRRISDNPDVDFDESIIQEIQDKIDIATKIMLDAIDVGNTLARESSIRNVSASEVIKLLRSSKEPRIVSNVAARAKGPQIDLFFNNDLRSLGGIADAHSEFTNSELHRINGCRVLRWATEMNVVLSVDDIPDIPKIVSFFEKSKVRIRTAVGTAEASILRCAAFTESSFDIEVSTGYDIRKRRDVLHLANILDPATIFNHAREILDDLDNGN